MYTGDASLDLEGVASDGDDGPPQALAGSVVAGGVGAMDTLAVGAQGAAPVAEGAGDTEQRIRLTVPGLPRGNLTVAVLKSRLQMYGGAMFVLDIKTRYKAPNEHIFNKGAIKRAELLDAWHRFMDTPGDQGGFDPARMLSDEDLVVRKAAPGSRAGTRRGARRGAAATVPTAHLPEHVEPLRFHAVHLQPRLKHRHGEITTRQVGHGLPDALLGHSRSLRDRGCALWRRSSERRSPSCSSWGSPSWSKHTGRHVEDSRGLVLSA